VRTSLTFPVGLFFLPTEYLSSEIYLLFLQI